MKTITGKVTFIASTKGIQLDNNRNVYYNPSSQIKDKVSQGLKGKTVTLTINENSKNNEIMQIDFTPQVNANSSSTTALGLPSKDLQILRESALKSAVEYCASRAYMEDKILLIAEKFEAWLIRR